MNPARQLAVALAAALSVAVSGSEIIPVRIQQTVEAQFPSALAFSPLTSGHASVIICVDATGQLSALLVAGYTDQAFADEAVHVLRQWTFLPARKDGEPVGSRLELRFDFSSPGRVVSMSTCDATEVLTRNFAPQARVTRVCPANELDHPLAAVQTVEPAHPGKLAPAPQPTDRTVIDFYVDEQGQARMPVVVRTTHEAFAEAAVGALTQWRFAPPTRHGKPVSVRVQQEFVFPGDS